MYKEGEYLVLQTYPLERNLIIKYQTAHHLDARHHCELQNMRHDYSCYALRLCYQGWLWTVNHDGSPFHRAQEQFWPVHPPLEAAIHEGTEDGELEVHYCTYPYLLVEQSRQAGTASGLSVSWR